MIYIKLNIKGHYVEVSEKIDEKYWEGKIGSTYEDYLANKWILLSDKQVKFHTNNPSASIEEVLNMKLNEKSLEQAISEKLFQLSMYDSSEEVNSFLVNGNPAWLTPNERANYRTSIEAAEMIELETVTFYINETLVTLPIEQAKLMLAQIQLYADACYLTTKQHETAIKKLESVKEVDNYNFKTGYPEKLQFNI